jgi:hypothetical protein
MNARHSISASIMRFAVSMGTRPEVANGYANWITELGKGVSYRKNCEEALLPIEQLVSILYLRIIRVLDLDPRLAVLAGLRLRHNTF